MHLLLCSAAIAQQPDTVVRDYFTGEINDAVNVDRGFPSSDEHLTIYSIQSHQTGRVGNVTDEAYIYQVIDAEPLSYSIFLNLSPSTGLLFPGAMLGDNCGLGNGYTPGLHEISSYSAKFFLSSADPRPGLTDFHMELWDGDPFAMFDTPGWGFTNTPIAGTDADFVDLPARTAFTATALLPEGVWTPNSTVWMIVSGSETGVNPSPCRLGWDIAYDHATIGNHAPTGDLMIAQSDNTGAGVCCSDGAACDVAGGLPCTGDAGGERGYCQDDHAETASWFTIGGSRCDAHGGSGFCSNFTAAIRSPAHATYSLVPVSASAGTINGNEIVLPPGVNSIELEIQMGNWDPHGNGILLKAYEADIDSSGYYSGFQGFLAPTLVPCTWDDDCIDAFGGVCRITGGECSGGPDCPLFPIEACQSPVCSFPNHRYYCEPGFVFCGRRDRIFFYPCGSSGVDLSTLDYRYATADSDGAGVAPPSPFVPQYAGTLRLDTSADCKGTFTVGFKPPPSSVIVDVYNQFLPLLGFIPAKITCEIGRCCNNVTGGGDCWDNVTEAQCQTMGTPPVVWDPDKTCTEPCCDCIDDSHCQDGSWCNGAEVCNDCICESAAPPGCDDNLACTVDTCIEDGWGGVYPEGHCENLADNILCGDGVGCTVDICDLAAQRCTNTPDDSLCDDGVGCTGLETCDPVLGCQPGLVPCDDGVRCTDDVCDESAQTCTNTPNDAICSDGTWCNGQETCDVVLGCQWASPPCGSAYCDEDRELCHSQPIPTVSHWGLIGLTLLLLITAKVCFSRREASHA